ncbi:MAG: right-handed parallel beta-helix repeat-containing protein [Phycisphaerae bacterium]|nr:right-handed parallel beta-helix repeat-containing protein [Phycisphaerae bacterium]
MGNTALYLGKDPNGVAYYTDIYAVVDIRDLSGTDFTLYRIKKAINPEDPNVPDPNEDSRYDWTNDPNGYFEDANLMSYMNLYKHSDELNKNVVIAGYGPQRIFGEHCLTCKYPYEYAVGSGTLHWGYNDVYSIGTGTLNLHYTPDANEGDVPNEVGVGVLDSGTGIYIYDENNDQYKIASTFGYIIWYIIGGPRVSDFIDEIAQNVDAMGTPTFADKILGGLIQDVNVTYQIENNEEELNPVDPNANEITITVTVDDLYEFATNGASLLTLHVDVPDEFEDMFDPNDFTYDFWNDTYYCYIDLSQINPSNPISKSITLQVNYMAEPMSTVEIDVTTTIDDLTETSDDISCDITNWSDPCSVSGVIYVNDDAAMSTSGTSWEYPYKTLQDAIARAIKTGSGIDTIWLAAGTYTAGESESFTIDKSIEIYGGFVGSESDPDERSNVSNKTIITVSDPCQDVFWMSTEDASRTYLLDGLTITGSGQSGIYLRRNTLDVQHCVISGNGAGVAGNNATLSVQDSVLTYNDLGLDMSFSGIAIDRSVFSFNGDVGIKMNDNGVFIGNSVISENINDGFNFISTDTTEILNCTIVNNSGYGLYGLSGSSTTRINNNIVYGNSNDTIPTGQYINDNVQSDPNFWFPYVGESNYVQYQLSPDSNNCIDSGNTMLVGYYSLDLYGQDRVENSTVDIGAVEFLPVADCDFNIDGIVNFIDYSEFAGVWYLDSNDPNYNVKYDFDTDGNIDVNDLCVLAENWLYGTMSTGTVTSTYQVDFGYRVPEIGMMMMSLPKFEIESISSAFVLDGTLLEIFDFEEKQPAQTFIEESAISLYSKAKDISVDKRFEIAKSKLDISKLATQETSTPYIVPKINLVQQEREQRLQQMKNGHILLDWLDEIWQSGDLAGSMTQEEYQEFRGSIENSEK